MEKSVAEPVATGVVDSPFAPEFFAVAAAGFFRVQENISITFVTLRSDYSTNPPTANTIVNARVLLPIPGAQALVAELNDFLAKQGLDPSKAITGDQKPN